MLCSVTPRLEVLFDHGLLVNSTLFSICLHLFLTSLLVGRDTSLGILDGLALKLGDGWTEASVEELDDAGTWNPIDLPPAVSRIRRIPGAFNPGISRVFRLRRP